MTSLPVRPQYKGAPGKYVILFFVFSDCFVWSVHSNGKNDFLLLLWRALARRLRDVCIRVLVIWHLMTHTIFASFVWARSTHAMSSRGQSACTVSFSLWESSALVCLSFRGRRGSHLLPAVQDPLLPRHWGKWARGARKKGGSGWWVRKGTFLLALIGRERGWAAGWWWCDLTDIIWSSGWCSAWLCPGRAGDVWGRRSWDWAHSIHLPCVWRVVGGYGTCHGEAWLAVEAGQDGGAMG